MFQKYQKGKVKSTCGWWFGQQKNGTHALEKITYEYEDHLIEKCPNPPKEYGKQKKQVHFNEKGNCANNNRKNNSEQYIYASMALMSGNDECPSGYYGDS